MPDSQSMNSNAPQSDSLVRMEGITKRFPGIVANQDVQLRVLRGAFHAVIGENGAGKSTLLNILYGRYRPDTGKVFVRDTDVTDALRGPQDAIGLGIGLVSQHYALIPALTVLENVVMGAEPTWIGGVLDVRSAMERIRDLAGHLGLKDLDLHVRAERLSVAAQQKVEILKALYRNAQILLLDEPTATLAPQEADSLFALLHKLGEEGATIVFVTHKIREVMSHSDAVTVLRRGQNAGDFVTRATDPQELLNAMIGPRSGDVRFTPEAGSVEKVRANLAGPLLHLSNVSVRNARRALAVQEAELKVASGEIVGGVDGSGQRELSEAIVGLRSLETGDMFLFEGSSERAVNLKSLSVRARQKRGVAYIPEDRHRSGMVMDFSIAENYLLGHEDNAEWGGGLLLKSSRLLERAARMIQDYDVRIGERDSTASGRDLSGGNQQKVVFARAIDSKPRLLVACQPTRGLDRGATEFVYNTLQDARARGTGILLFSLDLDEVLELSDRIAVMFNGRIVRVLPRSEATAERLGALMTGSAEGEKATSPQRTQRDTEENTEKEASLPSMPFDFYSITETNVADPDEEVGADRGSEMGTHPGEEGGR